MKFDEYYDQMKTIDVQNLNKIWKITGDDLGINISKLYLRKHALDFFLQRGYFRRAVTDEKGDIFIGEKSQEYLKYKVLRFELPYDKTKEYLRRLYLLFDDEIPEDFEEIILQYIQSKAVTFTNEEPIFIESTPFLKLILMVNYVHKNKVEIIKMFKSVDIEKGIVSRVHFITYLRTRRLLTDDGKYINTSNLVKWINNKEKSILDFYRFILVQLNSKALLDFFNIVIKIFKNSTQWIKVQEFEKIFNKFNREIETGLKLGLIDKQKYNEVVYMKLSPEAWYMITGERPSQWIKKDVLITPLKEIFVSYNFDPFVIQIIDYFGDTKKDKNKDPIKYSDDYFIISDISELQFTNKSLFDYSELVKCIKSNCDDIPSIIENEVLLEK